MEKCAHCGKESDSLETVIFFAGEKFQVCGIVCEMRYTQTLTDKLINKIEAKRKAEREEMDRILDSKILFIPPEFE